MLRHKSTYDRIAAMIPCYTATGDTTIIISTDGRQQTNTTRIRTILKHLARSRATDLVALNEKATHATDHRILQPLSLAPGLLLCPLKTRIPRVGGDTSIGYGNFHAVISVTANHNKPYQSTIKLTGGTEIPILWAPDTVKRYLKDARLAMTCTDHDPGIRPELTRIAQKQVEVMYDNVPSAIPARQRGHHISNISFNLIVNSLNALEMMYSSSPNTNTSGIS